MTGAAPDQPSWHGSDHTVGRHLAAVLGHAGYLDIGLLASLCYAPRRAKGYSADREPGRDIADNQRLGLKVLAEGWEWLVREGYLMPGRAAMAGS